MSRNMHLLLVLLVVTLTSAVDFGNVVDQILVNARNQIPEVVSFTQLHFSAKTWDPIEERFRVDESFDGVNGHLELGKFEREGEPTVTGPIDQLILESTFVTDLKISYDNFTANNFTSGETSTGQIRVTYDKAEIHNRILISRQGGSCRTNVRSFETKALSEPTASFNATSPEMSKTIFAKAKETLNFYVIQTLLTKGLPVFAKIVEGSEICSLL